MYIHIYILSTAHMHQSIDDASPGCCVTDKNHTLRNPFFEQSPEKPSLLEVSYYMG